MRKRTNHLRSPKTATLPWAVFVTRRDHGITKRVKCIHPMRSPVRPAVFGSGGVRAVRELKVGWCDRASVKIAREEDCLSCFAQEPSFWICCVGGARLVRGIGVWEAVSCGGGVGECCPLPEGRTRGEKIFVRCAFFCCKLSLVGCRGRLRSLT